MYLRVADAVQQIDVRLKRIDRDHLRAGRTGDARANAGEAVCGSVVARRAAPGTVEIRFARLRVANQDVTGREDGRSAHRVVDALAKKVREAHDLLVCKARARLAALRWMPGFEERPEHAAGSERRAIEVDGFRPDDIRTRLGTSRLRSVTVDAMNCPQRPRAIVRGR